MRRFFASEATEGTVTLSGSEAEHARRVLRMRPGDFFIAVSGGEEFVCRATEVGTEEILARIQERRQCPGEPRIAITLYVAYMKADKLELILQKAVELGMGTFAPFVSSRCVKLPKEGGKAGERFAKIADAAVKQCGRAREVRIEPALSFEQLLERIPGHESVLFAYENSEVPLKQVFSEVQGQRDLALVIGPEGGFSPEEAERIVAAGARQVSLGRRILRGETAAIALLALTAYEMGC